MHSSYLPTVVFPYLILAGTIEKVNGTGPDASRWFVGCFDASTSGSVSLYEAPGISDLDPVTCTRRCLDEGYQIAALTLEKCHCGNELHGLVISDCFNTFSHRGPKDISKDSTGERGFGRLLCLPCGARQGSFAVYRTHGPFLHNISLASSRDKVQAGMPFIMEVSGNLAGDPRQPTGIQCLQGQNLSYVLVEFRGKSPEGQSSQRVTVLDDGFFAVSNGWVLETPGKYQINVTVSNPLSQLFSTVHLSVLQPKPQGLVISLLHGPQGTPSCTPSSHTHSQTGAVETAYLGDPVTLQANIGDGLGVEFCWWFSRHKGEKKEGSEDERTIRNIKTDCLPDSKCLSSTVNWTFQTEGVHMVSVNASNAYSWTQETIHIVVVRPAVSNLTMVSVFGYELSTGQDITVDLELFTTIRHLLLLNLTLKAENDHSYGHSNDHNSKGNGIDNSNCTSVGSNSNSNDKDTNSNDKEIMDDNNIIDKNCNLNSNDSNGNSNNSNGNSTNNGKINDININDQKKTNDLCDYNTHSQSYDQSNTKNSDHGNDNNYDDRNGPEYDHNLVQHSNDQFGPNLTYIADINHNQSHSPDDLSHSTQVNLLSLSLPHTRTLAADLHPLQSSCHLRFQLQYHLPSTAGQYQLSAYVFSTTEPSSVLLSTVLPCTLVVYDNIRALRPSGTWSSVVPAQSELKLEVVSHANRVGSRVVWTISLDDITVVNRTTEEWTTKVSLPTAGRYQVTVKAFNPISWALFHTHILVQDPVGELALNVPSVVTKKQPTSVLFTVTAGSNVTVSVLVNTTLLYRSTSYATGEEAVVVLLFDHSGTAEVVLRVENLISSQNRSIDVFVKDRKPSSPVSIDAVWPRTTSLIHSLAVTAVTIYTAKQAYPTNTDITFLAQVDEPGRLEFLWYFGDSRPVRTTSRIITKRYHMPGRYSVVVVASDGVNSFTSEAVPLVVQRPVKINRLVHRASVLLNRTAVISCRVNVRTDLTYLWTFGDGTSRLGQNTVQHVFQRVGEFTVEVIMSNLVSSASMSSQIFVVERPCQPPPVKNMGPLKIKVRRYEAVRLGVTFEAEVDCDISRGLRYTWTLYNSSGQAFPLPPIDTHRQSITLPSHFLHYDIYTAIARVQVVGSVVYSNYSVRVEVVPSPPVAFIQSGTNIFINTRNISMVTLDGQRSYDPDFPSNPLSYSWRCKPISAIISSCFDQYVPTSSAFTFPASSLKRNFDQFLFTLTVRSGERFASAETFLTVTPNLIRKVSVYCLQCQGDHVNWDHAFSVSAVCESCNIAPKQIHYTWRLYLVNASSKPIREVPFCHTVDLHAPSAIIGGLAAPLPPRTSTLQPPPPAPFTPFIDQPAHPEALQYTQTIHPSTPTPWTEHAAKTPVTESSNTDMSLNMAGVSLSNVMKYAGKQISTPLNRSPVTAPIFSPFLPLSLPLTEDSQSLSGHPWKRRSVEPEGTNSAAQMETPPPSPNLTSPSSSSNTVDMSGDAGPAPIHSSSPINTKQKPAVSGGEPYHAPLGEFDPPEPPYPFSEYSPVVLDDGGNPFPATSGQSDTITEFPIDSDFPGDSDFPFPVLESGDMGGRPAEVGFKPSRTPPVPSVQTGSPTDTDYDVPFLGIEEGDPDISEGRPKDHVGDQSPGLGGDSGADPESAEDEGSNLVDSNPSLVVQEPTLLDLPRELVETGLFESYTYTGISSPLLSFRPFSLRPGSRYMLEVTANSHGTVLGRTQLSLATNPAPKGMTCQVQPSNGVEMHTHFSIFCTSGKEDLLYEYSFRVGNSPPRTLYRGRDFQYYFNLPSGDPDDNYKVTIYTEIRDSRFGTTTKPCPVTVRVQPSFLRNSSSPHRPDLELTELGLRNLSALVRFGNSVEIRNYISLLSSILNRFTLDTAANTRVLTHMRSGLISTTCELEISEQASMRDSIYILKELLHVTQQVTLVSARQVTAHIQAISELFAEPSVPVLHHLDDRTVDALVTLLSYSLQAAVATDDLTPGTSNADDIAQAAAVTDDHILDSSDGENITDAPAAPVDFEPESFADANFEQGKAFLTERAVQLVTESLQTASDLLLKYVLSSKTQEHSVSTSIMALHTAYHSQGPMSAIFSSGSITVYLPDSLDQLLFAPYGEETCVLSQLTVLTQNPYFWASSPLQLSGPVVDLSLYRCSTRRKIPVPSLPQPINIKFQQATRNSSASEYILLHSQVNYHSINITQQHLQQAIRLSVTFTVPTNKTFPVMLLFRMFERPSPSRYHLHRIHRWTGNSTHLCLPPSYLNAAGVGYLALLNADYGKPPRHRYLGSQVRYSLTLETSLCLSWDGHQGAWTHRDCTTQRGETTTAVNCSCNQLRKLTVVQQQIRSSHDTADLDQFLSLASDLAVVSVLVLCVCLYTLGLAICKKADVVSEKSEKVHYLADNSPSDPYLYAVTIHTGLRSAASLTAKVYIVLYGEDGVSQTRELQVPECTLFRRNSRNTFILSAVDCLGPLWGVHLWHDNSGPSPSWYLNRVEVSEVGRGHVKGRAWLFIGQCWLAVSESDGLVERRLRVCTQGIGFAKMLHLKLWDYLSDFHLWVSVYGRPSPSSFTHTQRLSVCLLLLLGYTCVNTLLISQMDDQMAFELGIIDVSPVSLTTGVLSVLAVLPMATAISFLFRLREVKPMGLGLELQLEHSRTDNYSVEDALSENDGVLESSLSWSGLQLWAQEAWRKKYQGPDLVSVSTGDLVNKGEDEETVIQRDLVNQMKEVLEIQGSRELELQRNNVGLVSQGKEGDLVKHRRRNTLTQNDLMTNRRDGDPVILKDLMTNRRDGDQVMLKDLVAHRTNRDLVIKGNHSTLVATDSKDLVPQKELRTQSQQLTSERDGKQVIHSNNRVAQVDGVAQSNGNLGIQKEKDPIAQAKGSSDSNLMLGNNVGDDDDDGHQAECPYRSCGYHVNNNLEVVGRRVRRTAHWCHHLGWALCLLLSLSCLALSAMLGIRFSSSKVLLWIHSLFLSLVSCIFLIQPAMICIVAVVVSWWYRNSPDFYSFTGFDIEALKLLSQLGSDRAEELQFRPPDYPQKGSSHFKKLLESRQRARYLRLVRPPTPAELRKTRGKKRKETLIHKTFRELFLYVSMLVLLLCITYGSSFSDHYLLNKALRVQFTRDPRNPFLSIQSHEDWWKFTQTSLLDVLYRNVSATTKAGTHIMIGEPALWKSEVSDSSPCQVTAAVLLTATAKQICSRLGCYSGPSAMVGLGLTRSEAVSRLKSLHSDGWLGRRTLVLKVQITLYSPAAHLFTSVTLLAERSTTGVLLPSANVQSTRIHHVLSAWDYVIIVCQLLFFLLSLLQLCRQVYSAGQQGLMGYWRTPCNWVEVCLLVGILVYYVYYICHSMIALEVVEVLQRHDYREHVDVSVLAVWEQSIRTLRGMVLFLLSMKCLGVLRVNRTMATSITVLMRSLTSLFWPMVSGLILLVALSCLGNLLFIQRSRAFSSPLCSLQTLLSHYRGLRGLRGLFLNGVHSSTSLSATLYHGALCLTSTVVWTAVVIGLMSSLVRAVKRANRRRDVLTLSDMAIYIRDRVFVLIGQHSSRWTDNHIAWRNYYLEEFESLVDELLFRLNALSNSLHHTLPPKTHRYREHSPSISPIQSPSSLDTQCSAVSLRTHMTEEILRNDNTDISVPSLSDHDEDSPRSTILRGQNCLSLSELESLAGAWTEVDQLVQNQGSDQAIHRTKTTDSRSLTKRAYRRPRMSDLGGIDTSSDTQATKPSHTAVVVKVIVHKTPGNREL